MQTILPYRQDSLNDYRLIIDTPPVIRKKIADIKTNFDEDYKGMVIAGGNPFIYLATFSQHELAEQSMNDALTRLAIGFMPFKLHLKDFGHIEEHEIYIRLAELEAAEYLVKEAKSLESFMLDARFNEIPRITIAQRLLPWQFENSWPKYQNKHFSGTFLADKMLLIKRMQGFRSWQVLKHMAFQNQLVL